jgi:hypothetical protein
MLTGSLAGWKLFLGVSVCCDSAMRAYARSAAGPAPSLANAWPRCFCGTFGRALLLLVAAAKAA